MKSGVTYENLESAFQGFAERRWVLVGCLPVLNEKAVALHR